MSVEANNNKKIRSASDDDVVVLDEEDRDQKSLRSNTADLKVIIGSADDAVIAQEGKKKSDQCQQKVFWHFSQALASQSRYVDALLSNPLEAIATPAAYATRSKKKNQRSNRSNEDNDDKDDDSDYKVISFPDIAPDLWEKMMECITSPASILRMSTTVAMAVAMELIVPYDKYEFTTGIELCDAIMSKHIEKRTQRVNLDKGVGIIKMIVMAHEKNLNETISAGMRWFTALLQCDEWHARRFFTVSHVQELAPVIDRFINGEGDNHRHKTRLKKEIEVKMNYRNEGCNLTIDGGKTGQDSIDILNPMFPRLLISHLRLIAAQKDAMCLVDKITITGCPVVDGTFVPDEDHFDKFFLDLTEEERRCLGSCLCLMRNNIGDWSIAEWDVDEESISRVMFECKGSRYNTLPPPKHWIKVLDAQMRNSDVSGHPEFKYFKSEKEVEIDFQE